MSLASFAQLLRSAGAAALWLLPGVLLAWLLRLDLARRRGSRVARGVLADAAIGLQAGCLAALLAGLPAPFGRASSALVLVALHGYLWLDHQLIKGLGMRMRVVLLGQARALVSLLPSARALGLGRFVVGLGVLVGADLLYLPLCAQLTSSTLAATLGVMFLTTALALSQARAPSADGESTLLEEERRVLCRVLSRVRTARARTPDDSEARFEDLLAGETFLRPDPRLPLFRLTQAFKGEERFTRAPSAPGRPHVVLLFLESFRAADVGVLGGRHAVTPAFDRASKEGILFSELYANGVQTTRAVVASLFGVLPRMTVTPEQRDPPSLFGLGDILSGEGYATGFFCSGDLAYEDKAQFFAGHGFSHLVGAERIMREVPGAVRDGWGVRDEFMFPPLLDWLRAEDAKQTPALACVFTVSNHHPWQCPVGHAVPLPHAADGPRGDHRRFLETMHYTDHCLGVFLDALRASDLWQRTVLVITADTGQPLGERGGNLMTVGELHEAGQHIPALLLAPGFYPAAQAAAVAWRVDDVASQIDLLPTLLDLLSLPGPHHAMGRSLLRRPQATPSAIMNNPVTEQWALRRERFAYVAGGASGKQELYDLVADRAERRNLAPSDPLRVVAYEAQLDTARRLLRELHAADAFAPKRRRR